MADSHPLIGAGALIGARAVGQIRVVSITDKHQCSSLRTTATGITIGESATHFGEHRIVCTVLVPATMSRASTACGRHDLLDVAHAVDVGGAQPEDVLHALQRGQCVDVLAQALEDRAAPFGALVHQRQAELVVRRRVDERGCARGFSARLRAVFEKNWFESATRSWSTMCTRERYVMLGVPSADAVATTAGSRPRSNG